MDHDRWPKAGARGRGTAEEFNVADDGILCSRLLAQKAAIA
jgi:hypothetical protein